MTVTAKAAITPGEIKDCEWVNETINHYGISRKEFAEEVGIDYTNLSKIIQKKYRLSKKNRKKIEDWIQKQETQSDILKKKYDSLHLTAARRMLTEDAEERKYLIFTLLELEQTLLKSIMDISGVPDDVLQNKMQLLFAEIIRLIKKTEDLGKEDKESYLDYCIQKLIALNEESDSCKKLNIIEQRYISQKKKDRPAKNQMEGQLGLFDNMPDDDTDDFDDSDTIWFDMEQVW